MDIYHIVGDDIGLAPNGDLALVFDTQETNQRIVRHLLTVTGTYIWNPQFGGDAPKYIGEPLTQELLTRIDADVKAAVLSDDDVSDDPAPEINRKVTSNGLVYTIRYYNLKSEKQDTISFEVV